MAHASPVLQIVADSQIEYRERYSSELDRSQRFIRAIANPNNHDHPTVAISSDWNQKKRLYICVALVTVRNEQVPVICIHPYPIDTPDCVIRDPVMNKLFFQITQDDFAAGFKRFRIMRKKLIQHQLRNYGRLRLMNDGQRDIQRVDDLRDARKIIEVYQLNRSQLVFSLAELVNENQLPVIYAATAIGSNIMTAIPSSSSSNSPEDREVRCAPTKGLWRGGEEILMVIPRLDRRRSFRLILEHQTASEGDSIPAGLVDTRTISFVTPPCPSPLNDHGIIHIPFVVYQNNQEIARFYFSYQSNQYQSTDTDDVFDHLDNYEVVAASDTTFDDTLFDDTN